MTGFRITVGVTAVLALLTSSPSARLIDKKGRVAATYGGIVERNNLETNLEALLAESK